MYMKKATAKSTKKTTKKVTAKRHGAVHHSAPVVRAKGFWGNDQSMVLLLAAGTIIFLVAGLLFAGWL